MPLILGTAGHIDHGKTALVRALTGQDTDRLREEKARGISIDLGFAWLDSAGGERAGVVDVPGHERFIRNMLAGAHGMDLVLFVVAADDGVMPQTEEHLDILHLLGVRRGVFVITKIDLVSAARVEAVREEIEILALGTTLDGAPIVPVSTVTGDGLEALRGIIADLLRAAPVRPADGYFRMAVDRVFVMRGHGVVATGTALDGSIAVGDTVRLLPGGATARIRALEVHGDAVAAARQGQRVAMNLAGVEGSALARGTVLCDPHIERATACFDARVEVRPGARRALPSHGRVRLHAGTAEALGRIVLLDGRRTLAAGETGWAQVVLRGPVAVARGDRFVLRDETARWTVGGGVVVRPFATAWRQAAASAVSILERLSHDDAAEAAAALLDAAPEFALGVESLAQALGVRVERVGAALHRVAHAIPIPDAGAPEAWTTAPRWERFAELVVGAVTAHHAAEPLAPGADLEHVRAGLPWEVPPRWFRWGVDRLVAAGTVARSERHIHRPGHRVVLGDASQDRALAVERLLDEAGFTPPDLRQLQETTGLPARELRAVLTVLEQERRVVRIAPELFWARRPCDEALARLAAHCRAHGEITAAAFRDLIGASRKFAIAFLDWTDRTGTTLRVGEARRLRR